MSPKQLRILRQRAFVKQGCRCCYCTNPIWTSDPEKFSSTYGISLKKAKYLQCTAEHLEAKQDGGPDTEENIAAACLWCNQRRHFGRPRNAPSALKYGLRVKFLVGNRQWHPAGALTI